MTPTLETKRLILRPVTLDDAPAAQVIFNDWDVVKYLDGKNVPWPYPDDGVFQFYKTKLLPMVQSGEALAWVIIEKSTQTLIGSIEIRPQSKKDSRGFWLGSAYHRKGYMSETLVTTTDYAFDVLGMKRMLLSNAAPNSASQRIKEIQGARLISTDTHQAVCGEVIREKWELIPDAWRASPLKKKYG